MHKVRNNLTIGEESIRKFCPDRQYDAVRPAGHGSESSGRAPDQRHCEQRAAQPQTQMRRRFT
jgi:hypothetical protein